MLRWIDPTVDPVWAAGLRKIDLSGRLADVVAARGQTGRRRTGELAERDRRKQDYEGTVT